MTDLGCNTVATVTIEEVDGKFFFSLDGGASRAGPYDTEEAATAAVTTMMQEAFANLALKTLFGEQK